MLNRRSYVKAVSIAVLVPLIANANTVYESKYQYNGFSEPAGVINQDLMNANQMSAFTYGYDKNGNAVTVTKTYSATNPLILNYGFDALGHMVSDNSSENNISYQYDLNNNLKSLTDKTGTNTRSYNSLNELMSMTGPSSNETFSYDAMDPNNMLSDSDNNQYRYDVTGAISTYTSPTKQAINDLYLGDGSLYSEQTSQGTQSFYFSGNDLINNNNPGETGLTSYVFGSDGKTMYFDNNTTPGILLTDLSGNVIGAGELQGSSYKDYSYTYQDLDQNDPLSTKQAGDINFIGYGGGYFDSLGQSQAQAMAGDFTNQQWMYVGVAGGGAIALGTASYGFYKFLQWWDPADNEPISTNVDPSDKEEGRSNSDSPETPYINKPISTNVGSSDKKESLSNAAIPDSKVSTCANTLGVPPVRLRDSIGIPSNTKIIFGKIYSIKEEKNLFPSSFDDLEITAQRVHSWKENNKNIEVYMVRGDAMFVVNGVTRLTIALYQKAKATSSTDGWREDIYKAASESFKTFYNEFIDK